MDLSALALTGRGGGQGLGEGGATLWAAFGMRGEEGMWTRAFQTQIHLSLDWLVNSFCDNGDQASNVDIRLSSLLVRALASQDGVGSPGNELVLQSSVFPVGLQLHSGHFVWTQN